MRHYRILYQADGGNCHTVFASADDQQSAIQRVVSEQYEVHSVSEVEFNPQLPIDATVQECEQWLRQLYNDFGLGFHPDTPADEYVDDDGNALDSEVVVALGDSTERLMSMIGDRAYEIGVEEFHRTMGTASGYAN